MIEEIENVQFKTMDLNYNPSILVSSLKLRVPSFKTPGHSAFTIHTYWKIFKQDKYTMNPGSQNYRSNKKIILVKNYF